VAYAVEFTRRAADQFRALPREVQQRMAPRISALADDPRPGGARKLAGGEDLYRLRVGDYRILYAIRDEVLLVLVVAMGHRREVYRRR
jgi:mRNA interferase RelE/StbE